MALITTVAGATSDSYATLVEASAILAFKTTAAWTAATSALQEALLKEAANILQMYAYWGIKSAATQRLRFPSSHHTNVTSGALEVREHIKRAQAFLANYLAENPTSGAAPRGADSVSVVGSFSLSGLGSIPGDALPADVLRELKPELKTSSPGEPGWWDGAKRAWV